MTYKGLFEDHITEKLAEIRRRNQPKRIQVNITILSILLQVINRLTEKLQANPKKRQK